MPGCLPASEFGKSACTTSSPTNGSCPSSWRHWRHGRTRSTSSSTAILTALSWRSPIESHAEQVAAACRKGTPVLVEKPLAPSVAAGRQIEQVVAETGTPVLVGYVLRHCAPMRLAHKVLCEAGIGQLVSVHATLGAYETLRLSRNRFATPAAYRILFDYSHEWDYLEWLVAPIRRVAAIAHTSGDLPLLEDPNVVDGVLEFEGNPIGTFHLDYVQDNGGRSCTFVGDRGSLHLDAGRGTVDVRSAGRRAVRSYDCAEPRDAMFTPPAGALPRHCPED